ncbi:MAG: hypothetical protein DRG58_01095 [Deltaproteobacteria bacterium]|nr:MAG: hypothetical protein DRG58_01095 [Deltaproteobacteria bacterium]
MELPEYVSLEEVKRVCQELNIRDWTILTEAKVQIEEARVIMEQIDLGGMDIPVEDFCTGLEVELEHGLRFKEANVTNNHPILTAKIVLAHFKESLDYYQRLEVAELEGDLLKAVKAQNWTKVERIYKELAHARLALSQAEIRLLS